VLQANHPQHAGGLQREQRFHNTGCPGLVEEAYLNTPGAPCTSCQCMGVLFEIPSGTEKLACNFFYSTVSPDHPQVGTGMSPHNPGLRPNFQVQHLLFPACGLTLQQVLASWDAWGHWRARKPRQQRTKQFWLRSRRRRTGRKRQLEQPARPRQRWKRRRGRLPGQRSRALQLAQLLQHHRHVQYPQPSLRLSISRHPPSPPTSKVG
jgi:hypothetical protein